MIDLDKMTEAELKTELENAQAALDYVREERLFTLGQTNMHIGAARVQYLRNQWDREEKNLTEKIAAIQQILNTRNYSGLR